MDEIRWAAPEWLALLWALPLVLAALYWTARERRRDEAALGDPAALRRRWAAPSAWSVRARALVLLVAMAATMVALARPQAGLRLVSTTNTGPDVVIVLDLSESMHARDVRPDRLTAAKREIAALLPSLEGSAIGFVGFAGEARVLSPLTTDLESLGDRIDGASPEEMEVPGTDIGGAIALAGQLLKRPGDRPRAIVLLTDGEQQAGPIDRGLPVARASGASLTVLGVGTPEGDIIPIVDSTGTVVGVKRDRMGREVHSRLDETGLRSLARAAGGRYERADGSSRAGRRAASYARGQELGSRGDNGGRSLRAYDERFHWLAAAAVLFLIIEALVPRRRRVA
jgi:Ca-activated chloride channel family protein